MSLRVEDKDEEISAEYLEQQWGMFKQTGVMTFRKMDETKVNALVSELREAIKSNYSF